MSFVNSVNESWAGLAVLPQQDVARHNGGSGLVGARLTSLVLSGGSGLVVDRLTSLVLSSVATSHRRSSSDTSSLLSLWSAIASAMSSLSSLWSAKTSNTFRMLVAQANACFLSR